MLRLVRFGYGRLAMADVQGNVFLGEDVTMMEECSINHACPIFNLAEYDCTICNMTQSRAVYQSVTQIEPNEQRIV